MTTYAELRVKVADALQDPDNETFEVTSIDAMIEAGWADLSDYAPRRFQEDITPIADALSYQPLADDFPVPNDDIDLLTVEIWDGSVTPPNPLRHVAPASKHPTGLSYSEAGWRFWGGLLYVPTWVPDYINVTDHLIRIWGYSPWPLNTEDDDVIPFGQVHEQAIIIRCQIEAWRRLINNRALFTQWQTRSNNTDVTPGFLMSEKERANEEWRRLIRRIAKPRERP